MVAMYPGKAGVRGGLDIFDIWVEKSETHIRGETTPCGIEQAAGRTAGRNCGEQVRIEVLLPSELTLVKRGGQLRLTGVQQPGAQVQQRGRRYRLIVIDADGLRHRILGRRAGKHLREAIRPG